MSSSQIEQTNSDIKETTERSDKLIKDLTSRLNRIEGQVRGIKSMVQSGAYCDDLLTQISAAQSAMSSIVKLLLESHMKSCVAARLKSGDDEIIDEFVKTIGRLL
ncbi:MAG: metal-sensing transcriptional repressor [Defluviitaleaceae bacterium]|nr:metal-sensing transcriptional repressor [Defluviitaleaceae bacterium]